MSELDTAVVETPPPARDKPKRAWVRNEIVSLYGTGYQPTLQDMIPDDANAWRSRDDVHEDDEITGAGRPGPDSNPDKPSETSATFESTYRQKILARKCLNMLVDIRSGLVRQNRFLEILIEELQDPGIDLPQS